MPSLRALAGCPWLRLAGVVTQPPRVAGRGRQPRPSPVQVAALELGLPVMTPERLRRAEAVTTLRAWCPDVLVVAAYGQILSPTVLAVPTRGSLNVHASLLPRYRGASPVMAAILDGTEVTGVTIMLMDAGLDTGPVLAVAREAIRPDDTTGSLTARLADLGAGLLVDTLPAWLAGTVTPTPQDDTLATITRLTSKEDGALQWSHAADRLARQVRACQPWPGAYTVDDAGQRLVILSAEAVDAAVTVPPGTGCRDATGRPAIACGVGLVVPRHVQPAGRNRILYRDYLNGRRRAADAVSFAAGTV